MAEEIESTSENVETTQPTLNEEKLGELIKKGFKESLESLGQQSQQQTAQEPKDPWDEVLEPRINKRTQQSNITAQSAEDKVDFYTSDYWLTELDEMLPGDLDTDEGKVAVGQYIKKNKTSYIEGVSKKSSLKKEMEVTKAKRAVDMSTGNISNFSPEQIHKMDQSKIDEQFGNVLF